MHLADAFIQSGLQCIQVIHLLSVRVFPGNRTHNLCAANAMLCHWATVDASVLTLSQCVCVSGEVCESVLAPCALRACKNGGVCHESEDFQSFSCTCPAGWQGKSVWECVWVCALHAVAAGEHLWRWGCGTLAQQTISQTILHKTVWLIWTQLLYLQCFCQSSPLKRTLEERLYRVRFVSGVRHCHVIENCAATERDQPWF